MGDPNDPELEAKRGDGVAFETTVSTRAYNTVLAYHPDTHHGPPIALGWRHVSQCTTLEDHNGKHKSIHCIPTDERVQQLKEYGYTVEDMKEAIKEVQRVHFSRVESMEAAMGRGSAASTTSSRRRSSSGSQQSYKATVIRRSSGR